MQHQIEIVRPPPPEYPTLPTFHYLNSYSQTPPLFSRSAGPKSNFKKLKARQSFSIDECPLGARNQMQVEGLHSQETSTTGYRGGSVHQWSPKPTILCSAFIFRSYRPQQFWQPNWGWFCLGHAMMPQISSRGAGAPPLEETTSGRKPNFAKKLKPATDGTRRDTRQR